MSLFVSCTLQKALENTETFTGSITLDMREEDWKRTFPCLVYKRKQGKPFCFKIGPPEQPVLDVSRGNEIVEALPVGERALYAMAFDVFAHAEVQLDILPIISEAAHCVHFNLSKNMSGVVRSLCEIQ